ncbi:MAG: lamin tail domain-containing protein [Phycisphaeraceae bacterium]|nr:lamin tail domain-containing protein [Phycisphaeraceae bacterium]
MLGRMNQCVCAIGAAMALAALAPAQTVITQWTFNSNPPDGNTATGTFSPAVGLGTAACYNVLPAIPLVECIFANGAGSTDPGADNSGWQTRGYQNQGENPGLVGVEFAADTSNFTGIVISWDHRHSNTSSRYVNVFYSVDGVNFVEAPSAPFESNAGDTWFNDRTVDLSAISAANNNPNFKFRISPVFAPSTSQYVAANGASTYASTGTHRFDMVTVRGTATGSIPPSVVATAAPGAVCAAGGLITLSAVVVPGLLPDSTGLAVTANLTEVGGGAAVALLDDGLNGDEFAGDNIFTLRYTVPAGVSIGAKTIPITVSDAQSRSGSTNVSFAVADCSVNSSSRVVISQVYGGGGNLGPPAGIFNADFVEIHNRSAMPVDLSGWSVQYASQTSLNGFDNPADRVELFGAIQPGQYMLVQFSAIGAAGAPLPTPDFVGTGGMGNNGGRVALVRGTALIGSNCNDPNIEDFAGYGAAICFEGAAPAGRTENNTGAVRKLAGAQDTDQNFHDFEIAAPSPRNRSFGGFLAGYPSIAPEAVSAGESVSFTVNVSAATTPPSTGVQVRANLSSIGGTANQLLTDNGGGVWTLNHAIPASVTQGVKLVPITVTDAQSRSDSSAVSLRVATCIDSAARIVVSGFFGGGGNAGAPFDSDHIEIFNRSQSAVDVNGWSVQYSDGSNATGFIASRVVPLSGVMGPGEYRLIRTNLPGSNGVPIPTPDFLPAAPFGMDNANGRIAVARTTDALGADCGSALIEDLVGYGAALCQEGIGTTPAISNISGGYRLLEGCRDTDQNLLDFVIAEPLFFPRNSASPANLCPAPSTGACCTGSICTITTAAACSGTFYAGAACNAPGNNTTPCCLADYDQSGTVNVPDIFAFLAGWFAGDARADFNNSGGSDVPDIFAFLAAWFAGCP